MQRTLDFIRSMVATHPAELLPVKLSIRNRVVFTKETIGVCTSVFLDISFVARNNQRLFITETKGDGSSAFRQMEGHPSAPPL